MKDLEGYIVDRQKLKRRLVDGHERVVDEMMSSIEHLYRTEVEDAYDERLKIAEDMLRRMSKFMTEIHEKIEPMKRGEFFIDLPMYDWDNSTSRGCIERDMRSFKKLLVGHIRDKK